MLTFLMRHARTGYSATYRVNGRVDAGIVLDEVGREQCRAARATLPVDRIATCVVSQLDRTAQTAGLLLGRCVPMVMDARLNEIDYGEFEGRTFLEYGRWLRTNGPWQRPSSASESQREAILRMLDGLLGALVHPGPRLVVAHGLLLSVVRNARSGQSVTNAFFPEAPYVTAVGLTDHSLPGLVRAISEEIKRTRPVTCPLTPAEIVPAAGGDLATFSAAEPYKAESSEDVDRHA